MSITGIHGQLLEVTVVSGYKLKDTEWISRQDPYVCLEYGSTKFRTQTCTDGGKNPTFREKFMFTLIEGLRELNIQVWNSNTLSVDDFIGSGKVQLHRALSTGFDDSCWPLQTKTGRNAGEIKLILYYPEARKASPFYAPSAPPYVPPPGNSHAPPYPAPASSYPPPSSAHYYPPPPPASVNPYSYPPSSPYPSYSCDYTSSLYPPPPAAYPPSPYPSTSVYPQSPYPPPPASSYYPPGPYSGSYHHPPPY
ncbi:protein SRC2-like protein [Senna tora]|uniref:Protein SRC2-like protein n=1 Tax=Senna tora TaxID=362788 RepID=A0A834X976_9FABA|nr:protein SRC2-like protein [Senna tora]